MAGSALSHSGCGQMCMFTPAYRMMRLKGEDDPYALILRKHFGHLRNKYGEHMSIAFVMPQGPLTIPYVVD